MLVSPVASTKSFQSAGTIESGNSKGLNWPLTPSHNESDKVTSGQFMVSKLDDSDNEDDCFGQIGGIALCNGSATPGPRLANELINANIEMIGEPVDQSIIELDNSNQMGSKATFSIDESLTKLLDCLTLAYSGKITSPKWNQFKGIRFHLKDKVRLNNIIWREYHMQYVKRRNPIVVHFAAPLTENHGKPEAVVMEGKYWKRRLDTICNEYKRWRVWYKNLSTKYHSEYAEVSNAELLELTAKNEVRRLQNKRPSPPPTLDDIFMDFDNLDLFMEQPFTFPNPRDIGQLGNADIMQPGLIQLQPNLDDVIMSDVLYNILQSSGSMMIDNDNTVSWQNASTDLTSLDNYSGCGPMVIDSSSSVLMQPTVTTTSLHHHPTPNLRSALLQDSPMSFVTPTSMCKMATAPLPQSHLSTSQCAYPTTLAHQGSEFLVPPIPSLTPANPKMSKKPQQSQPQNRVKRKHNKPIYIQPKMESPNKKTPIPIAPSPITSIHQTTRSSVTSPYYTPPPPPQPPPQQQFCKAEKTPAPRQTMQRNRSSGNLQTMAETAQTTPDRQSLLKMVNKVMTGGSLPSSHLQHPPKSVIKHYPNTTQPNTNSNHVSLVTRHASNPDPLTNTPHPVYTPSAAVHGAGVLPGRRFSDTACSTSSHTATAAAATPNFYLGERKHTQIVHLEDLLKSPSNSLHQSATGSLSLLSRAPYPISSTISTPHRQKIQDSPGTDSNSHPVSLTASSLSSDRNLLNSLSQSGLTAINVFSPLPNPKPSMYSPAPASPGSSTSANNSEMMRRNCIGASLSRLQELVNHTTYPSDLTNLTPQKLSKATVLYKTAQTIKKTRHDLAQKDREIARIKEEIEQLQNSISSCCSQLPATGVAVSRQRANQGKEWFEAYVKASTLMNWKFYIFSLIIGDLFDSYNTTVSTNSMDQFSQTLSTWIDQNCSLMKLRPLGMTAMRTLSTTTSILTDAKLLPEQATAAVLNSSSPGSMEASCNRQYEAPTSSICPSLSSYVTNYLPSVTPIPQSEAYPEFIPSVCNPDLDNSSTSSYRKEFGDNSCDSYHYH